MDMYFKPGDISLTEIDFSGKYRKSIEDSFSIFLLEEENAGKKHCRLYLKLPRVHYSLNIDSRYGQKLYELRISEKIYDIIESLLLLPASFYRTHHQFNLSELTFSRFVKEISLISKYIANCRGFWKSIYARLRIICLMIGKEAIEQFSSNQHNRSSEIVVIDFLTLIIEFSMKERTVKFYADRLDVSPNYLNMVCKKKFGKSASSLINNEIIANIASILALSTKSIKEISYAFNFNDLSTFSTFFKNNTGLSPKDFVDSLKTDGKT
ncbi:MAG: helix-turn-helix domain-containing protein [Sphingobacterium sp.]|jgi:AraC-like DNA-binding protein|nr:helix-turn-helix domain-containing protein [Sphingobacterium sp.]